MGRGGWVVDFGISEFEGMWIGLVCGSEVWIGDGVRRGEVRCVARRCVDRRCKTVNRERKTHRGSVFGSVIGLP